MTHTVTIEPFDAAVLDAANWRPVTPAEATETLGAMTMTADEPGALAARVETLADGRVRLIYQAYLKPFNFEGQGDGPGPYLMLIYPPEGGAGQKSVWLRRTDMALAFA